MPGRPVDSAVGVIQGSPAIRRRFASLSEAEDENGQSRIYLGIHWRFDKTEGIAQGRKVADYVYQNAFTGNQSPLQNGRWA